MKKIYTMKYFIQACLCFIICIAGQNIHAQETSGGLRGQVLDASNQPLPGGTVTAVHTASGTKYSTATDKNGRYNLPGLRVGGPYTIEVKFLSMNTETRTIEQISLGDPLTLNFILTDNTKTLSEVVVKGTKSGPKANNYGAGQNISRDQIKNQPTISRSITDITKMVPQGSKDNSFAGTNFRYNNVTIDGAINNDAIGFSPSAGGQTGSSGMPGSSTRTNPVSLDAIEAIQVYIAPYDVKIGNFTGGSINAVSRSGTNEVHGSVYGFGRNASLVGPDNTGTELNKKLPSAFHDYQTGFRLGFPLIKNKLFFFTNEEITRRQDPVLEVAGSPATAGILSAADAQKIIDYSIKNYNFDPGTAGQYNSSSNSIKFFNRLDWNIDDKSQLAIRNNYIRSDAINMERDQFDFRFGSIAYRQNNNQNSTVAELKTRFRNNFSNSAVVGYTTIHDYRTPTSDPSFPQVQIVGNTPGSTIFFGTDREASIFNMKQNTIEITDNLVWNLGKHTLTVGTHNELYKINYGFVNAWNGRVTYQSIGDFLNNNPERVQGSYNYTDNSRNYILANPGAKFNINFYSAYIQDEIQISDRFRFIPGIRFDYQDVPTKQVLSDKTRNAFTDPYFGTSYTYTPLNQISGNYLGKVQASPRVGFRFDAYNDQTLVLRGGLGMFTSRIPFAWLGYAFYNNGNTYGSYDQKTDGNPPYVFNGNPLKHQPGTGIGGFAGQNGQVINEVNAGKTQVDAVDNNFTMPKVLRGSLALDYKDQAGFKYTVEGIYTKTIKDVIFRQVNLTDNPTYFAYDTAATQRKQPIFPGQNPRNPQFANAYEMSNTSQGYRYSITGQIARNFDNGFGFSAAYTYGKSKDVSNGIRNSFESNWQLNQALNPNNPQLANSNFDIRNRIVVSANYRKAWNKMWVSNFSLFVTAQSGSPYTYGFVNYTPQNTPQQIGLAYIPARGESANFFAATSTQTVQQQADAFDSFIDHDKYLSTRRGTFTERNAARTPWNNNADFHFAQDINFNTDKDASKLQTLTISVDIMNLTNLVDKNWGKVYFSPNTYNSTSSVGLIPYIPARSSQGYPLYQFVNPGVPYSVDPLASRWQMQLGARYTF
ncbi:Carboxypeptidase regulatory-like domain-containing protein [Mucilaginibacter pineti]|uniref:Carboxypeptidase regulatory-like domain-containing protein n=1 Tax=Mucilaginibacter pineti TaxID=1391627 RepID=A0A1G6XII6_9SPHI|nr:TonB-dependent receptor [Mucilaginibacter pineti]SDD78019.1 Carboxypeptidase regulatory-like domain-containing protein [Mucilaginibacter pineti]